jgi:hypothetical protein
MATCQGGTAMYRNARISPEHLVDTKRIPAIKRAARTCPRPTERTATFPRSLPSRLPQCSVDLLVGELAVPHAVLHPEDASLMRLMVDTVSGNRSSYLTRPLESPK